MKAEGKVLFTVDYTGTGAMDVTVTRRATATGISEQQRCVAMTAISPPCIMEFEGTPVFGEHSSSFVPTNVENGNCAERRWLYPSTGTRVRIYSELTYRRMG